MRMLRPVAAACGTLLALSSLSAQNTCALFDRTVEGRIDVTMTPDVVPQTGITIEAWITYDDSVIPTGQWLYPTIVRQGDNAGNPSENYFLRMNCDNGAARRLRWKVVDSNGAQFNCDYLFAAGEFLNWTHVAATYDGAFLKLFVNGNEVSSVAAAGQPIRSNGDPLRIGMGSLVASPIEVFNGQLDEVRLWPFARSAADIQSTMNMELSFVPGRVSTWNMSGDGSDTSNGQNGAITGQVSFVSGGPALTPQVLPLGLPTGASTPGCLGDLLLTPSGAMTPGNLGFGLVCGRTPPGALAVWAATAGVLPGPFPILGVDIWVDPTVLVIGTSIADALGSTRFDVPVGATAPFGASISAQCLVLDPACAVDLFTASDAGTYVVQ